MTIRGIAYVIVEALLFFLSFGTANREIFICFICVTLVGLFSFLSVLYNALFLNISATLSRQQVTRGDSVDFKVFLSGFVLFPSTVGIDISIPGTKKFCSCAFYVIPGFSKKTHACSVPCKHRGEWNITVKKLRVYDLFGFFKFSIAQTSLRHNTFALPLLVCPKTHNIDKKPRLHYAEKGMEFSSYKPSENGDTFGDTRTYRHGDSMRQIHWVQTMRARKIYVRRYEEQKDHAVLVLLDCSFLKGKNTTADIATETALAILNAYERSGIPSRLICQNSKIIDMRAYNLQIDSQAEIQTATQMLTKVKFIKQTDAVTVHNLGIGRKYHISAIHIITPQVTPSLESEVNELLGKGIHASVWVPSKEGTADGIYSYIPTCGCIAEKVGEQI